jgi:hypothetical protein
MAGMQGMYHDARRLLQCMVSIHTHTPRKSLYEEAMLGCKWRRFIKSVHAREWACW